MNNFLAMTCVFLCLVLIGATTFLGWSYIHEGQGLHPVIAGVVGLTAFIGGFWASGEVTE